MKRIALLPVRNESWVLRHSLACLSAFCDIVLVNDQASEDDSRAICREFPKVHLLESRVPQVCEQARWALFDAARDYDGCNLLWCTDADEVVSPALARECFARDAAALAPGVAVDCEYYHVWGDAARYRTAGWPYQPYWKPIAIVDDRRMDYGRARALPLHEERVPVEHATRRLQAADLPVLHLQWLLPKRNQMRQAWYRCREWMHGDRTLVEINALYAVTLPGGQVPTAPVPRSWVSDITFPDTRVDDEVTWQQREILHWFSERGPQFFEPLEIWHLDVLRAAFVAAAGREPVADRSHHPGLRELAGRTAKRLAGAARRRLAGVRR